MSPLPNRPRKPAPSKPRRRKTQLRLEPLEERALLTCATISGFVYQDANSNGLFDRGEMVIANSKIELRDAANVVVGTAVTDANGYYEFRNDQTVDLDPVTITKTVEFGPVQTNFDLKGLLDQFDPDLGELTSVEITHAGSVTSEIKVENTSLPSGSVINGTVSGSLTLKAPGVDDKLELSEYAGSFTAGKFDGDIDFTGPSGTSFGKKSANGSRVLTLTGDSLTPYVGKGKVEVREIAVASSQADGGGNLVANVESTGRVTLTVKYTYTPSDCFKPGNYTIIQTEQPPGYLDGRESSGGTVLTTPPGTDRIPVTVAEEDLPDNNFGELLPTSISGFVYHDVNNNGQINNAEAPIPGVKVTLTGLDDQGNQVAKEATTNDKGFYQFAGLRPGTYSVREAQPVGWLDGKDTVGSLGGDVANDRFDNIVLPQGGQSINNNFGELKPASVSGFVYADDDNDGVKDAGEQGIPGTTVTLTGPAGATRTAATDAAGFYEFKDLTPGTYSLTETQPPGWADGKDTIGTQGGVAGNDKFENVTLLSQTKGENNNFGELRSARLSGHVYFDADDDGTRDAAEQGIGGVKVELSGFDLTGPVKLTTTTAADGSYRFDNLRPGTYTITETQPAGWLDGKDRIGSLGGTPANDQARNITVPAGADGTDYDFGEIKPGSLAGFVYVDNNDDALRGPGEAGIPGVTVTLTGRDSQGNLVQKQTTTGPLGAYEFNNLAPGTYTLRETQPPAYQDGKDTVGSLGGDLGNDVLSRILLGMGQAGVNYNFGERPQDSDVGIVKKASSPVSRVGDNLTYTLLVTNHGPQIARDVVVTDALPAGTTFVTYSGSDWSLAFANAVVTAAMPALPVGATSQISITVKVPGLTSTLTNTGVVTTTTPDRNPDNNRSTVTTLVEGEPGAVLPKATPFLVTSFGRPPVISKNQLFNNDPLGSLSPAVAGNLTFVDGVQRTLTGKSATMGKSIQAVQALTAGKSRAQFVSEVWDSDDHRSSQAESFYNAYLRRDPTAAEKAAAVRTLRSGAGEFGLVEDLLTSADYQKLHPSSQLLAAGLYRDVLGKLPDTTAHQTLINSMDNQPLNEVVRALLNSKESLAATVDEVFRSTLRRPASSAEIARWSDQLEGGSLTAGALAQKLLATEEFFQLAARSART